MIYPGCLTLIIAFLLLLLLPFFFAHLMLAALAKLGLSAPAVVSIGGAGTFDGIVLSGLIAALLA